MSKKKAEVRSSAKAKAGKRHGPFVMPPDPNPDKLAARERGEKQFVTSTQQYVEQNVNTYDKKGQFFRQKVIAVSVGYSFDEQRGRILRSPVKEKDS